VFIVIGLLAGLMAGALGLGGGIVIVPCLVFFLQSTHIIPEFMIMHVAVATSMAVILCTALATLRTHTQLGEILWPVFYKLWPGIALGACVGAVASLFISAEPLRLLFTLFLILIAVKMWLDLHRTIKPRLIPSWLNHILSFFIGSISALLGIGGGVLLVPFLTYAGIPIRKIAPIANLCGFIIALVGVVLFIIMGLDPMESIKYTWGYVYWPAVLGIAIPGSLIAPFGAKLNYIVPTRYLRYGVLIILILTALKMIF
jgi:uncharacterized membrane protein YfcA